MFAPTSHLQAAEMELHQSHTVGIALAMIAALGVIVTVLAVSDLGSPSAFVLLPV